MSLIKVDSGSIHPTAYYTTNICKIGQDKPISMSILFGITTSITLATPVSKLTYLGNSVTPCVLLGEAFVGWGTRLVHLAHTPLLIYALNDVESPITIGVADNWSEYIDSVQSLNINPVNYDGDVYLVYRSSGSSIGIQYPVMGIFLG